MSKQANPTKIGLFIVLGVALGLIGLILFSSVRWFTHTHDFILYFNDSLNGLDEGAPVKYRGVTVGSVKRVMIHFNQAPHDYAMPVLIEVRDDLLEKNMGEISNPFTDAADGLGEHHLRATLEAESLVTGVLYIEVHPNNRAPAAVYHEVKAIYPELPTEPTDIQQLLSNVAGLDIKGTVAKVDTLLSKLDFAISSLNVAEISRDATNALISFNMVARLPQITNSLNELQATLQQYHALGEKLNQRVDPLADSVTNTLAEASRTLAQLRGSAEDLHAMLTPDSPLRNDLDQALEQLAGAAQSIAALAEFLKQHPNALVTGRKLPTEKP